MENLLPELPLVSLLVILLLTLYLTRSKVEHGNVIEKYTESSSLSGTKYFIGIFQKLYVDGGTIDSGRRIKILEISKKDYESLEIMDEVKVLKKTNEVIYHKSPEIISVNDIEKYFIDFSGDKADITNFKNKRVFREYF
jgi:hypothetical protein